MFMYFILCLGKPAVSAVEYSSLEISTTIKKAQKIQDSITEFASLESPAHLVWSLDSVAWHGDVRPRSLTMLFLKTARLHNTSHSSTEDKNSEKNWQSKRRWEVAKCYLALDVQSTPWACFESNVTKRGDYALPNKNPSTCYRRTLTKWRTGWDSPLKHTRWSWRWFARVPHVRLSTILTEARNYVEPTQATSAASRAHILEQGRFVLACPERQSAVQTCSRSDAQLRRH